MGRGQVGPGVCRSEIVRRPAVPSGRGRGRRRIARGRRRARRDRRRARSAPARASRSSSSTRRAFPRDKTCGDGLTTGALRLLDCLGFDVRALPSYVSVTETVLVSPTGREVVVPLPRNGEYAGVVPRIELDAAFVAHARATGVDIREHTSVVDVQRNQATPWSATFGDGTTLRAAMGDRRRRPLLPGSSDAGATAEVGAPTTRIPTAPTSARGMRSASTSPGSTTVASG